MNEFCRELPKIELHAHLNGSLSESTLQHLGCDETLISEYRNKNSDIHQVFRKFRIAHELTNNTENVYLVTRNVIAEFAKDNVIYLELRTTPRSGPLMTQQDYVNAVIQAVMDAKNEGIIVKLLLSVDRRKTYHEQRALVAFIIAFRKKYPNLVRGVDFSGDPNKGYFYADLFKMAKNADLYITIHCAEVPNYGESKEMILVKPNRLGHCTFLHPKYGGDESAWELYKRSRIPVECCITSNVVSLTSKSYEEHHFQEWIKDGLPCCLGTDDKGIFDTTLSREYLIAHTYYNLSELQLWKLSRNAIDYSFATYEEKMLLRQKLDQWKETYQFNTNDESG